MNKTFTNIELVLITAVIVVIIVALFILEPPLWLSLIILAILMLASLGVFLSEIGDGNNE